MKIIELRRKMKEEEKWNAHVATLKQQINSMYGKMVSSTKIPSKYFRPIQRRLKIENIFDGADRKCGHSGGTIGADTVSMDYASLYSNTMRMNISMKSILRKRSINKIYA